MPGQLDRRLRTRGVGRRRLKIGENIDLYGSKLGRLLGASQKVKKFVQKVRKVQKDCSGTFVFSRWRR